MAYIALRIAECIVIRERRGGGGRKRGLGELVPAVVASFGQ